MISGGAALVFNGFSVSVLRGQGLVDHHQVLGGGAAELRKNGFMGVDVVLVRVEQRGTGPKRRRVSHVDVVHDPQGTFSDLCEASALPMLSRVKPWGTLVLSSNEMDQFISEVETELAQLSDPGAGELLAGVLRLARECREQRMMQLHLDGD